MNKLAVWYVEYRHPEYGYDHQIVDGTDAKNKLVKELLKIPNTSPRVVRLDRCGK